MSEDNFEDLRASREVQGKAPKCMLPAPFLFENVRMLETLFQEDKPAQFLVRH